MNPKHTPGLLTTIEAAKVLRLSPRTLERLRVQGTGTGVSAAHAKTA